MASGGHSSSRCAGHSPPRLLLLRSTGSRRAGSVTVAHGPSCSATCGIFPDQGSNPCPLHWQADSQPLHHQGSPRLPNSFQGCLCSKESWNILWLPMVQRARMLTAHYKISVSLTQCSFPVMQSTVQVLFGPLPTAPWELGLRK